MVVNLVEGDEEDSEPGASDTGGGEAYAVTQGPNEQESLTTILKEIAARQERMFEHFCRQGRERRSDGRSSRLRDNGQRNDHRNSQNRRRDLYLSKNEELDKQLEQKHQRLANHGATASSSQEDEGSRGASPERWDSEGDGSADAEAA
ncbi:hypothetical protein KEM55_002687 [Ascosphaera atra]|nr:hypothetical protein KEM55_002687 [Ascosphaera atra]